MSFSNKNIVATLNSLECPERNRIPWKRIKPHQLMFIVYKNKTGMPKEK